MAQYSGTSQVNDVNKTEINKAILDLLKKINELEKRVSTLEGNT